LDWTVGEVLATLQRKGFSKDTLVVFSSDNGGAIKDTYDDGTNALHALQPPNGLLRGAKGQLYEGGHREPFLARWPGHIRAGSESSALLGLVDMVATAAAITGQKLPAGAAMDSVNVLPALLGEAGSKGREQLVLQNNNRAPLGLRAGAWKLVEKNGGKAELYDLSKDLPEMHDLALENPAKLAELKALLAAERAKGMP